MPGLIENCPHAYEYPLVDRDPDCAMDVRPRHADGRRRASDVPDRLQRRLAGDFDARVITREIPAHGPTNAALVAYEAERRPATTDLVMLNRRNGPEQVMQMVEERAPDGYDVVTDVLSLKELEDIAANYKRARRLSRSKASTPSRRSSSSRG